MVILINIHSYWSQSSLVCKPASTLKENVYPELPTLGMGEEGKSNLKKADTAESTLIFKKKTSRCLLDQVGCWVMKTQESISQRDFRGVY